ncbi:MAG: type 11 methyltransferase [Bacteroidetes bacterium]|nr:MAG: type 11 methyltransferase [Bacteroidota bacterium]
MLYFDGKQYDRFMQVASPNELPFYLDLSKHFGNKVLELGIGTGRVGLELAAAGCTVSGIDLFQPMLDEAAGKAEKRGLKLDLTCADMSNFDLGTDFDLVIIAFNSIHHLLGHEQLGGLFSCIKKHLRANGAFAFDMSNLSVFPSGDQVEEYMLRKYIHPENNKEVEIHIRQTYDPLQQIQYMAWSYLQEGKTIRQEQVNLRVYAPQEMEGYLKFNGFRIIGKYGSFEKADYELTGEKVIYVTRLASAQA